MTPKEYVMRTGEGKVKDKIAEVRKRHGKILLITADSVITLDGKVFEKPESAEHACLMLKIFRDAGEHEAMTSVWITIIIDHEIVNQ
jgi:predicted house-cleaning NTP pyrophosphatase (Maf/HAM1 superfamily)